MYDLIIIGAGPSGVSAALYAQAFGLKPLLLERKQVGGLIRYASLVTHYTGLVPGEGGPEYSERLEDQLRTAGVELRYEEVTKVELASEVKKITTTKSTYEAKAVILATGTTPRALDLPETYGAGQTNENSLEAVSCAEIFVLGGSDGAVKQALYLAKTASKVHIVQIADRVLAVPEFAEQLANNPKIEIHCESELVGLRGSEGVITGVTLRNAKTGEETEYHSCTCSPYHVFVYIGQYPNSKIFEEAFELQNGFIPTTENVKTKYEGVFASGDIAVKSIRQIATAVADGCFAANAARAYLNSKK